LLLPEGSKENDGKMDLKGRTGGLMKQLVEANLDVFASN